MVGLFQTALEYKSILQNILQGWLIFTSLAVIACLVLILRLTRKSTAAKWMAINLIATLIWVFGYLMEWSFTDFSQKIIWHNFQYIGILLLPISWILLILSFLDFTRVHRVIIWFGGLYYFITIFMVYINPFRLFYEDVTLQHWQGIPILSFSYGIYVNWAILSTSIICFIISVLLLLRYAVKFPGLPRFQSITLLSTMTFPFIVKVYTILVSTLVPLPDIAVGMIPFSIAIIFLGVQSSGLFRVTHISSDLIMSSLPDPIIIIDKAGFLISYNHAARRMFPFLEPNLLNQDFKSVLPSSSHPIQWVLSNLEESFLEVLLEEDDIPTYFEVQISPIMISNTLGGYSLIFRNVNEQILLLNQEQYTANHDSLTQLYNRGAFYREAEKLYRKAHRKNEYFVLVIMDLDGFKEINDTCGHLVGDRIVQHVARLIQENAIPGTISARFTGDEFYCALAVPDLSLVEEACHRFRKMVVNDPYRRQNGERIFLDISIGQAIHRPGNTMIPFDTLMSLADENMYAEKRAKKGIKG